MNKFDNKKDEISLIWNKEFIIDLSSTFKILLHNNLVEKVFILENISVNILDKQLITEIILRNLPEIVPPYIYVYIHKIYENKEFNIIYKKPINNYIFIPNKLDK